MPFTHFLTVTLTVAFFPFLPISFSSITHWVNDVFVVLLYALVMWTVLSLQWTHFPYMQLFLHELQPTLQQICSSMLAVSMSFNWRSFTARKLSFSCNLHMHVSQPKRGEDDRKGKSMSSGLGFLPKIFCGFFLSCPSTSSAFLICS